MIGVKIIKIKKLSQIIINTLGTLTGVGTQAGYINEKGEFPRLNQALMADALGTTMGAILGTSTVTTYIESATGISEGGKTGFTAIIVAFLFIISIFLSLYFLQFLL